MIELVSARDRVFDRLYDLFRRLKAVIVERQRAPDRDNPRASVERRTINMGMGVAGKTRARL